MRITARINLDIYFVALLIGSSTISPLYGQWVLSTKGVPSTLNYNLVFTDAQTGWAGGGWTKTTDGGNTWLSISHSDSDYSGKVFFINDSLGWKAAYHLYKTTTGGKQWRQISDSVILPHYSTQQTIGFNAIWFINPSTGWAAGDYNAITETTDGGESWHYQHTAWLASDGWDYAFYNIQFTDSLHGWANGTVHTGLNFRTTDGGSTWIGNDTGMQSTYLEDLSFTDSMHGWVAANERGIYSTRDGGQTWQLQNDFTGGDSANRVYSFYCIRFTDTLNGWAGGNVYDEDSNHNVIDILGSLLRTTDGGTTWNRFLFPAGGKFFLSMAFPTKDVGYAITDSGYIFKYTAPLSVHEQPKPVSSSLLMNYPNPFSGATTIETTLTDEERSHARLYVFNMLGDKVSDLTALLRQSNYISFNANTLPAGAYYCVLETPSIRLTRQLFVVK